MPAAFALSRMRFWGSATLATGVFLTYLIPETLLFIPLFKMMAVFNELTGIELINRWWVLLILYPTLTVPFCTWIMIGYFASIPKELDEAALIDGATWMQTLTKIFIPVALPGIIAATIFAFTVSWAQFLYPLAFTTSASQLVLPVGIITSLIKGDVFNWGQIMTGALLGAAPPLIIYAFLMDYYIAGPDRRRHQRLRRVSYHGERIAAASRQEVRRRAGGARHRSRHPGPRVRGAGRPVRLRQDHDAAHDRRARGHHRRRDRHRRRRRQRRAAEGPRHRDGVPELRALSAHDGGTRTCRSACG